MWVTLKIATKPHILEFAPACNTENEKVNKAWNGDWNEDLLGLYKVRALNLNNLCGESDLLKPSC